MFQHFAKRAFPLLVLVVWCIAFVSPTHASADGIDIFFIARQQNGDGRLYFVSYEGKATLLSPPTGNVSQFLAAGDGRKVAYLTANAPASLIIHDLPKSTSMSVAIDGLENARLLQFDQHIWLIKEEKSKPPTLYAIDASTGAIIAQRQFRFPEVQVLLHPSGRWAVAYRIGDDALALEIFSLPWLKAQPFSVNGQATGAPRWSSTAPLLLIPGTNAQSGSSGVFLVNVERGSVAFVEIADADPLGLWAEWSAGGGYVLYRGNRMNGAPLAGLIHTASGSVLDLSHLRWQRSLGWAARDRGVLLTVSTNTAQQAIQFVVVEVSGGKVIDLRPALESIQPLAMGWADSSDTVAFIGRQSFGANYLLYSYHLQDGTLRTALATQDPSFSQAQLLGVKGQHAFVLTIQPPTDRSTSALESSLLAIDLQSGRIGRLSPAGFFIDPFSVWMRK